MLVRWVDSSLQHGWQDLSELREELAEIVSVGLLARKDRKMIILIQSYDKINKNFADGIVIPRCAIKSIEKIGEGGD